MIVSNWRCYTALARSCGRIGSIHLATVPTPIVTHAPGSELFEALLVVAIAPFVALVRQLADGGAEGAGGARGDDHGWDSEERTGATGLQATDAIGAEEG